MATKIGGVPFKPESKATTGGKLVPASSVPNGLAIGSRTNGSNRSASAQALGALSSRTPARPSDVVDKERQTDQARAMFVANALQGKAKNESKHYDTLVSELNKAPHVSDRTAIGRWFIALAKSASVIKPEMRGLVEALFSFDWQAPLSVVEAYCTLLLHLSTSSGTFVSQCLRAFAKAFLVTATSSPAGTPPEMQSVPANKLHEVVHQTLQRLLELTPGAATPLFTVLHETFPHRRLDVGIQQTYLQNLLRLFEYAPFLRDRILTVIVERLIHLDVEIVLDDEQEEQDDLLFPISDAAEEKAEQNKESADKLDSLMTIMFNYLTLVQASAAPLADEVFESLLRVFERSILKTHKSRFTQFLVFHYCSLKHSYAEEFLRRLTDRTFNASVHLIERQSAAAYAASFIARANYLRAASAIAWFELLLKWLHAYALYYQKSAKSKGTVGPIEAGTHAIFYSITQAVFYIFCHRQETFKSLQDTAPKQVENWRLQELVDTPLNPLRYCSADVVGEFADVARAFRLADCRAVMETNEKYRALGALSDAKSMISTGGGPLNASTGALATLERFFPFDPYQLKNSSRFLDGLYRTYHSLAEDDPKSPAMRPLNSRAVPSKSIAMASSLDSVESVGSELSAMSMSLTDSPPIRKHARGSNPPSLSLSESPPVRRGFKIARRSSGAESLKEEREEDEEEDEDHDDRSRGRNVNVFSPDQQSSQDEEEE